MVKKVLRQALQVKPDELIKLGKKLKKELKENYDEWGFKKYRIKLKEMRCVINIINKQPKCSDTWEIEW